MAPTYTFTGAYPRVFFGLSEGVNAHVQPTEAHPDLVDGQTVVLEPGDHVTTDQPYEHCELEPVADKPAPAPVPTPAPAPPAEPAPANE